MSEGKLPHEDVLEIIRMVELGDSFTEFRLKYEGIEIEISKGGRRPALAEAEVVAVAPEPLRFPTAAPDAPAAASGAAAIAAGMVVIKAPMVGTFYSASEPGAQPFVKIGSKVHANDTVCIIEVMKLMNALAAETSGEVVDVLVADGETVEYDQPLVVIKPTQ